MWTDIKVRHFISLTAHYVCDGNLKSQILSVHQFTEDEKSGLNVRDNIESALINFGLEPQQILDNVYFVTDQGSNVKLALSIYHRIPCSCHIIATVLRHTLQLQALSSTVLPMNESDDTMSFVRMLHRTIDAAKSLVAYFKKTGLNNKLSCSLKQCNATRWNSLLTLLQSLSKVYDEVKKVLHDANQENRLQNIDMIVVNALINFLMPFQDATLALESECHPTIHHVYQWNVKLKRSVQQSFIDPPFISFLKRRALCALNEKFLIFPIHKLALFLNPKFKSLRILSPSEKAEVHNLARSLISHLSDSEALPNASASNSSHLQQQNDHTYMPPQKKSLLSIDDEFLDWQDCDDVVTGSVDEVLAYERYIFEDDFTNVFFHDRKFDILQFWSSSLVKAKFPKLCRIASGVLSIPASSASSERAFSLCSNTVTKKRSLLSASSVNSLVVMNSQYHAE